MNKHDRLLFFHMTVTVTHVYGLTILVLLHVGGFAIVERQSGQVVHWQLVVLFLLLFWTAQE